MSNESIFGMFAESPFSALQKHMDLGKQAAIALQNFLTSAIWIIIVLTKPLSNLNSFCFIFKS